jgi:hypothetical protein
MVDPHPPEVEGVREKDWTRENFERTAVGIGTKGDI